MKRFKKLHIWFGSISAVIALTLVSSYSVTAQLQEERDAINFSDLSDAEIDWIISVKEEMHATQTLAESTP